MSDAYPDARTWAQEHSLANVPRLARLEGFAFHAHPEIVASFGPDGAAMARFAAEHRRSPARTAKNWLVGVLGGIALLSPMLGVAVYGRAAPYIAPTADPIAAPVSVPIAGICFAVCTLVQIGLWIAWLRGGARWSPVVLGVAGISAVLAAFAASGIPRVSSRDAFAAGAWMIPVWTALILGGALAIAVLLRVRAGRRGAVEEEPPARPTVSDGERARRLVLELPEAERRLARVDRDDALRILAARGLIDDATLTRALSADLGTLFTLDPVREG